MDRLPQPQGIAVRRVPDDRRLLYPRRRISVSADGDTSIAGQDRIVRPPSIDRTHTVEHLAFGKHIALSIQTDQGSSDVEINRIIVVRVRYNGISISPVLFNAVCELTILLDEEVIPSIESLVLGQTTLDQDDDDQCYVAGAHAHGTIANFKEANVKPAACSPLG